MVSMARFRRYLRLGSLFLLLAQVATLSIPPVFASEMTESVDEATLASFQANKPNYLPIEPQVLSTEVPHEAVQEFSFVEKTFRTFVGQPVLLQFTSTLEANEVLVRIPENGKIVDTQLSSDYSVTHSQGEYWLVKTNQKQKFFELPVVFETAGQNFITVDNDADHFYLEVEESNSENGFIDSESQNEPDLTDSKENEVNKRPIAIQPVIAREKNLSIPDEVIALEEARILKEITNSRNMSLVTNWSQFRSAWNSSNNIGDIRLQNNINFSSSVLGSSLNKLNNSYRIISSDLGFDRNASINMGTSGNSLQLENSSLVIRRTTIESENSGSQPLIDLNISSTFEIDTRTTILNRRNSPALSLNDRSLASVHNRDSRKFIFNQAAVSPVRLSNNSMFAFHEGGVVVGSNSVSNTWVPPISSDANSTITFSRINNHDNNVMMGGRINVTVPIIPNLTHLTTYRVPWNSVVAEITGVNGSIVTSSTSDPNDFSERYLANHNLVDYRSITVGATASDGFVPPPRPSYELLLEASPLDGGNPTAEITTITQGETTTLHANPTETFDFLRWEIVSGTDSMIAAETSEVTTFTMGTSDTTVRAVYQKKQGGDVLVKYLDESLVQLAEPRVLRGLLEEDYETEPIEIEGYTLKEMPENAKGKFTKEEQTVTYLYTKDVLDPVSPVDPLAPETEVDPENPPELSEEQGALSIDFVSRFSFGKQGISTQTTNYYAQPQRLLNPDGTVNETEERPNYVQISDRRDESDRHGWTLSVTQNGQFINPQKHELKGSRLQLTNQQVASVQNIGEPDLSQPDGIKLIPGEKTELMTAKDEQGVGTWVYRFGDAASADKSVVLEVPPSAAPRASTYQTTLIWELSSVPDNQK